MGFFKRERVTRETKEDDKVRDLLQRLGEAEWGREKFIINSDPSETGEEGGWIIRKMAESYHYHVGRDLEGRFFIRTGGETILTEELSQEALDEALKRGPTHLEPPGKKGS